MFAAVAALGPGEPLGDCAKLAAVGRGEPPAPAAPPPPRLAVVVVVVVELFVRVAARVEVVVVRDPESTDQSHDYSSAK